MLDGCLKVLFTCEGLGSMVNMSLNSQASSTGVHPPPRIPVSLG